MHLLTRPLGGAELTPGICKSSMRIIASHVAHLACACFGGGGEPAQLCGKLVVSAQRRGFDIRVMASFNVICIALLLASYL